MRLPSARDIWAALQIRNFSQAERLSLSEKIPRRIHQLWVPPDHLKGIPSDVLPQTKAWNDFHPDFEHRIWTIDEAAASIPNLRAKKMMEAVRVARFEAMKADIVRLYLLSEFGGFWSDLKVKPRRRWLNEYLNKDLILVEHFPFERLPDPTGILTNNFFGCVPNSPFVEACIDRINYNIERRLSTTVWEITGPRVFMDVHSIWREKNQISPESAVLPWSYAWNEFVEMGHGSYSSHDRHWSVREKQESIYLD